MRPRGPTVELVSFHWLGAALRYLREAVETRVAFPWLLLIAGLVLVQPGRGDSVRFDNTGSLGTARSHHTATLLRSGNVLVAGGNNDSAILASAELYDPASESWTATGSLATARSGHRATLLPNGKVLVTGGASAEMYDPTGETWEDAGSLNTPRGSHTATLLPSGKVLVAGGDTTGSAELYDPATGTWMPTGSLIIARDGSTATLLSNGKVLVAGGFHSGVLASTELFDPATGTWMATGSLGATRFRHTATLLPNGKVLVAGGGQSTELYDPASGTWTPTDNLLWGRYDNTATLLPNGKVLVAGGDYSPGHLWSPTAELYDPETGAWRTTGSGLQRCECHSATLLANGKLLLAGGDRTNSFPAVYLASSQLYGSKPALLNISTRMRVLTDDSVLIAGFIVTGTDPKRILIRGIGPSLNVPGNTLSDPTLELHQRSMTIETNDNWKTRLDGTSQQSEIEATSIPPADELESAILATLAPGAYTAILAGKNRGTGIGLVEVYDLGQSTDSELGNISTRGFVDTDDSVAIGGLIIDGGGTAHVLVRALGPSIPVAGALGNPTLELHDGSGTTIAFNDNWKTRPDGSSQQAEIEATGIPPANDLESALFQAFPAGNYTAIVRGMNGTTGVGLVEAYNLQ